MLNVGIIGIGFMGMIHYRAYQRVRGVKVRAICEQDPQRRAGDWRSIKGNFGPPGETTDLAGVVQYAELNAMLADPRLDLIDVCLPTAQHPAATVAALRSGKHVFCEKPIALRAADASRMVEAARQAERMLMIGHVLPFFPEYRFAYDTITGGRYGRLTGGHFRRIIADPPWLAGYYDPRVIGGPMLDLHVHDAHFIRLLCGMPRAVQSRGRMRGEVVERFDTQFLFDDPSLAITASGGVIAQQGRPFAHGFELYLERATLAFDFSVMADGAVLTTPLTVLAEGGKVLRPKLGSGDPVDAFVAELGEAARAIRRNTPSPFLAADLARDAVVLCSRETQSVRSGRPVRVG
jgi:predicted dehydrogenase